LGSLLRADTEALAKGAGVQKSEFANSDNHLHHSQELGLFEDERATAISISSDGAQLTMKKQSNIWLLIVVLNLPPVLRFSYLTVHINGLSLGPLLYFVIHSHQAQTMTHTPPIAD
jgi:hypothetical protein